MGKGEEGNEETRVSLLRGIASRADEARFFAFPTKSETGSNSRWPEYWDYVKNVGWQNT
jgi:hypothetical protein